MGLLDHVGSTISKAGGSSIKSSGKDERQPSADDTKGAAAEDTEELDEESGNILMSLVGQLRIGMDLSKVTLPTFVLEPRSMLERITVSLVFTTGRMESRESLIILLEGDADPSKRSATFQITSLILLIVELMVLILSLFLYLTIHWHYTGFSISRWLQDFMSHPDLIFGWVVTSPRSLSSSLSLLLFLYSSISLSLQAEYSTFTPLYPFPYHSYPRRAGKIESPEERFLQVTRYYLSGWHIKPKGVKKPYNPVLGEHFRCEYEYPDGTKGYYVAEQGE